MILGVFPDSLATMSREEESKKVFLDMSVLIFSSLKYYEC